MGSSTWNFRQPYRLTMMVPIPTSLLVLLFTFLSLCGLNTAFSVYSLPTHQQRLSPLSLASPEIPGGRVPDVNQWMEWSDASLERLSGESLLSRMDDVNSVEEIHSNTRYAVLSHGTQDDPIYNYFNQGALDQFQWPEPDIYAIPSRYSAPSGNVREERSELMQKVVETDIRVFPTAIRQNKHGEQFQLTDVLLWNVYNGKGERVGQTALFDRTLVQPVMAEEK